MLGSMNELVFIFALILSLHLKRKFPIFVGNVTTLNTWQIKRAGYFPAAMTSLVNLVFGKSTAAAKTRWRTWCRRSGGGWTRHRIVRISHHRRSKSGPKSSAIIWACEHKSQNRKSKGFKVNPQLMEHCGNRLLSAGRHKAEW